MTTSARVGRPAAGDSAETHRRLLQAARERFARDGYDATTNKQIAADVGITTNAIYHYVDSKAALYAAVYCDTVDRVYGEFESAAAAESHLLARFTAVLRCAKDLQTEDPSIAGFIVAVTQEVRNHPDLHELLGPQLGRHHRFFSDLVAEAAAAGELQPDVNHDGLTDLLGSVLSGLARLVAVTGDPQRYIAAVDAFERFLDGSLVRPRST